MAVIERTLSFMLRNSGAVLDEVERRDVILRRRDGEDLYLGLRSRERGIRESLEVLTRVLRAALHDKSTHAALAEWLASDLPWTSFLPPEDREAFLADFVQTSAACVDIDSYEPLVRSIQGWKATAEAYANPAVVKLLTKKHKGPAISLRRPTGARARAR
jgi:hypothetical protein